MEVSGLKHLLSANVCSLISLAQGRLSGCHCKCFNVWSHSNEAWEGMLGDAASVDDALGSLAEKVLLHWHMLFHVQIIQVVAKLFPRRSS